MIDRGITGRALSSGSAGGAANTATTNTDTTSTATTSTTAASQEGATPPTKREMLDQINTAIQSVLIGGQSYKIGSRALTRADLKQLQALRAELAAEVAADDGGNGLLDDCYVAIFDRR